MTIPHRRVPASECRTPLKITDGIGMMVRGGCSPPRSDALGLFSRGDLTPSEIGLNGWPISELLEHLRWQPP